MPTKILVIEDDPGMRSLIRDVLKYAEYEFSEAINGREGLEIARNYMPDLIICDVMMPDLNGYDVLLELQATSATANIPFIFLTALTSRDNILKGMALGADDYITKPFDPPELLFTIKRRLEKRALILHEATYELEALRKYINVSLPHELRTPLTGIKGYLDILLLTLDSIDKERSREMLERMSFSVERMYRLVENHIIYARLTSMQNDPETLALIENMSQCTEAGQLIAFTAKKISHLYQRPGDLQIEVSNASVHVYGEHFKKVIYEIIDNAFKFSETGQTVSIQSHSAGDQYVVEVQDQGVGMSPQEISQIGPNRQFNRDVNEQQGNGLGLIIALEIMKIYNGQLNFHTDERQGLGVSLSFPLL